MRNVRSLLTSFEFVEFMMYVTTVVVGIVLTVISFYAMAFVGLLVLALIGPTVMFLGSGVRIGLIRQENADVVVDMLSLMNGKNVYAYRVHSGKNRLVLEAGLYEVSVASVKDWIIVWGGRKGVYWVKNDWDRIVDYALHRLVETKTF